MRLPALSLDLAAVAFAGAGLVFLARPDLLALVDLAPATATARSDVRAVFGGLELGLGAWFAICARRSDWHRAGLVAQALAFGGLALGRLLSVLSDGVPRGITFALWAPDLPGAAPSLVALRRRRADPGARAS